MENQVRMCMEYIRANIPGGAEAKILVYEDEGFSGKNTKRPRFQQMMEDMRKNHFQYLVCYRLDRLGRNIADLALLIDKLNRENTEFISIRERFDTTTPMGKAMLYFSGVLAQMEREQIAERVRDNMAMLARDGRWLGGNTPLGFTVREEKKVLEDGKIKKSCCLQIEEREAEVVKQIFAAYLESRSLTAVAGELLEKGLYTRRGKAYTAQGLRDILTNPVYCTADETAWEYFAGLGCRLCMEKEEAGPDRGLIGYGKTTSADYKNESCQPKQWIIAPGKHEGIISGKDFVKVQKILEGNKRTDPGSVKVRNRTSLLAGLLYCSCGHKMRPKYYRPLREALEKERKFSYRCPYRDATRQMLCQNPPVPGNALDEQVCRLLLEQTKKRFQTETLLDWALKRIERRKKVPVSETAFFRLQISRNREKIRNLLSALEYSRGEKAFVRRVEEEIGKLEAECKKAEKEIRKREKDRTGDREIRRKEIWNLGKTLLSFERLFASMTVEEKREYLAVRAERMEWNGSFLEIWLR